jgi:hypothetical protein
MRIISNKNKVGRYQQGGQMMPVGAPEGSAPVEQAPVEAPAQGGQDQMVAQLEQMAMEIIQSIGPEASAMLAEMIVAILQQGAAPQQGQPVFRRGGRIAYRK